ncbi:MAG: hypothetical protein PHO76_02535 [Methylotenera sp.]|nr:hypothetical protein [Methylotenera sp.]MDD4927555.1 hypothetical protein [Methylotenera sp.]
MFKKMCYYSDLFGDVIVTIDDVNLWLDVVPNLQGASNHLRNYYLKHNDIANKIKLSKLNHSFEKLINDRNIAVLYAEIELEMFKPVYKIEPTEVLKSKCPDHFHECENPKCLIFVKRVAHEKSAAAYAKRKKYKRHA